MLVPGGGPLKRTPGPVDELRISEREEEHTQATSQSFLLDRPGEEGGWGQLGQFQRHMVGGGVNHLGGRRGGAGCGFSGPGDPCGERNTAFDSTLVVSCGVWRGNREGGGGSSFDVGGSAVVRTAMLG